MLEVIAVIVTAISGGLLIFLLGFVTGYGFRRLRNLLGELRHDLDDRRQIEETESAVVDDSPKHLKAKYRARVDKGEDPIDDGESQIVNTKTPQQFKQEAEAAKEAKLDKWMPGIKR